MLVVVVCTVGGGCGGNICMCASVVVVKVVEQTARGMVSRGKPAGGVGDKHCWSPGDRKKTTHAKGNKDSAEISRVRTFARGISARQLKHSHRKNTTKGLFVWLTYLFDCLHDCMLSWLLYCIACLIAYLLDCMITCLFEKIDQKFVIKRIENNTVEI